MKNKNTHADIARPNPDELLASLQQEEEVKNRGRLKIFFGMSPGVGKTYDMLRTARSDSEKGVQVVVGIVETHNRPETKALLEGLPIVPRKKTEYKGAVLEEMDLETILEMHPYLVLVDELAHTNAPGSRHLKRYQDVLELLDNGINVYTTLNVQHLESRVDTVAQITGITIRETLPDEIFERADEVELIDITPNELFVRLAEGKVYTPERSQEAVRNFFRKGNITALREMSLRMVAERVDKQLKNYMRQNRISGPWKSGLHLLVLVSSSPTSVLLIRWTRTTAFALGADWKALYVETPQTLNEKSKQQLSDNINLVRQLGGELITAAGNDLVKTCLDVAHRENIAHIIVGKSYKSSNFIAVFSGKNFVNRLIRESDDIDVHVVGMKETAKGKSKRRFWGLFKPESTLGEYMAAGLSIIVTALLCLPVADKIGYESVAFIQLFILSILAIFLRVGPVLLAAFLSALAWNFFFIPPQFTLYIDSPTNVLTFVMFFTIALLNGILTSRIRKQERFAVSREERTNALFHLTKGLTSAAGIKEVVEISTEDIRKYFSVEAFFIIRDGDGHLINKKYISTKQTLSESEMGIADWVFKHGKNAGRFTETLPSGEYTYYLLKGSRLKLGVVAVKQNKAFSGETGIFWDTFLSQISNAIEHQHLGHLARRSTLLNESDKLYKTLFNSISHELRIPVATIMGASDTLLATDYPDNVKTILHGEILNASKRLNRLIENLLNMSRLESGRVAVHLDWCDIHDLFNRVAENLAEELKPFRFDIVVPGSMPLLKLDFGLMEQVLYNLVYNSSQYASAGTTIRLKVFYDKDHLVLQEMDRGPGFAPDMLSHVFDKFYRAKNNKTEGLGLGLSIVKGFVEAHKGVVYAENRQNGGARFTIQIPSEISYGKENE